MAIRHTATLGVKSPLQCGFSDYSIQKLKALLNVL